MGKNTNIAHIIHPVIVPSTSDLVIAQPITFETMRTAREFVSNRVDVNVELYAVQYCDEECISLPGSFIRTRDLTRSVADVGVFRKKRKLALIKDILDILYASCDADYLIYTNVDIALQPYFYQVVADIIRQGHDAFIINRRTIPGHYKSIEEIPLMYAEIGDKHPGWDCFVFGRELYPRFRLGNACIGTDWIGRMMIANMVPLAKQFKVFQDLQMTFHIGDDRVWQTNEFSDYAEHNKEECRKILEEFDKKYGPFDRKGLPGRFLTKFT
ncbi:MAG: hypothetical protein QG657_5798 [Acidobacteriota bacterium]|nr:hypothetical protein [Acidobacteriota bacterium]